MQKVFNTNLFGAIQTTETFIPLLEKSTQRPPRLVFVSTPLSSFAQDSNPGAHAIYRSSKTALNMMVVQYAHRFRDEGWEVNLSCPGFLATNLNGYRGTGKVEGGAVNISRWRRWVWKGRR